MKATYNSPNTQLSTSASSSRTLSIWSGLKETVTQWASRAVEFLSGDRENAPRIYAKCDRTGHRYFKAVDPVTNETYRFDSAHEVRVWLEKRYYR